MKTADELLTQVNAFLDALPYERTPKSLYEPIRYVLSMGGKRIRPVLMLLGYNLYQFNLSHFRYTFVLFCKMCSKNPAKVHKDLPLHKF